MNDCIEGEPVNQVSNFFYLTANISGDRMIDRDLQIRGGGGEMTMFFDHLAYATPPPPKKN